MINSEQKEIVTYPSSSFNKSDDQVFYEYVFDSAKYRFITPNVKKILGYTIQELNETGFAKLILKQIEENKSIYPLNDNSDGLQLEENLITYLIETKNGEQKWIEDNSISICDLDNNKTTRIGTLRDVSERIRAEKIRQTILDILDASNSEKNFEELFGFIHSCIKKLMKADNFYIAYHKKDSDLLTFPYFVDEVDKDSSSKKLGKGLTEYILRTGKSELVDMKKDEELRQKGEIELIGPQSPIWLGVPLKIKDKTIGVMVVQDYHNATTYNDNHLQILDVISYPISRAIERKMVEEERKDLIVKLKEMNTLKDRLFSLISHDLRAPFNSLLGFAEILRTEFENLTHRDIKEYINVINDSSNSLFEMTNNLLHYSRLQLNKYNYTPKKIIVSEIINKAIDALKFRIEKKKIHFKVNVKNNYSLIADEEILFTLFKNIVSNSIKFSKRDSNVKIFSEEITDSNNIIKVQITIRDEGIGISADNKALIDSESMFSTQGTEKEPGSGLGLLLAKKYVELNDGTLEIISTEGSGTSVILIFPGIKS